MNLEEAAEITCPHCWESLTIMLDLSVPEQDYIEDCQVCCQPIRIAYTCADGELLSISAEQSD
jgi:hypothetical protein